MDSNTSFVTVSEFETAWQDLSESDEDRASALLLMASNYLRQIANNNRVDLDMRFQTDDVYASMVKMVVISATQRAMAKPVDVAPDASSWSQSATPYSESMSFAQNDSGNIYFKNKELQLLGLGSISGNRQIAILRGVR